MKPADTAMRAATIRAFAERLMALEAKGGNPSSLYDEIYAAGLTLEVAELLERQARAYADHSDALAREWLDRDRIVRAVK